MDDLVRWLTACLDEDALWATEASRRYSANAVEGGVHWQWEDSDTDEIVTPDPSREEVIGGESFRVALRSKETWPTHSVGELPQFAIPTAEEVPSAVGGHIVRWDPARVLREVSGKRQLLALLPDIQHADQLIEGEYGSSDGLAGKALAALLAPYPKCGATAVFWPEDEACDAVCVWPRVHDGTRHMDEVLGEWDEDELPTSRPSE